jgi:hypothetical protein
MNKQHQTQKIRKVDVLREQFLDSDEKFLLDYLQGFNRKSNREFEEDESKEFAWEYEL